MTNLFRRVKNSVTADLHEMLDQKEQKNPISLLNQYLRECEKEIEKVRKLIERQYVLKEEFTREYVQAKDLAEKRKHQAAVALKAGEQELYEFANGEQIQYEDRMNRLEEANRTTMEQLDTLERNYTEMQHKLKDMQLKRLELMGKENVARANYRVSKMLEQSNQSSTSFTRFSEMENYLERLEHQVNSSYFRNTIDARIAKLEKQQSENTVTQS
ncbi:PspA/IM30 family protein [Caldibacillus lycopersici]|uniref:PspA/IM30 family protein n=1 Tax=Perspicuibacillus lycopersici TaxID=1325689 RepID=A0AAE3IYP9_9BACI|nr:PspA/IM30 family protein [Perspicuibacillus lycopersici]MCU9614490.1 PspA/IM30 family protein [Perspicuibacillus lycopersici]